MAVRIALVAALLCLLVLTPGSDGRRLQDNTIGNLNGEAPQVVASRCSLRSL